ncbi:MAG: DegT/DnrJ/EryC1/StrS family aminotransferase [Candidatus Staskawiczbacteria bacterium]|nr:DegT/DnrJ/EryC1/StrS family aminotransferase [Candidatus Staskawiczbacteria bacterium]MBI3337471.1 DegT/DnrJ/EryC1/StrS family aminotransferase [Candidatus Staskawiczbacteria bacterium]
MILKNHFKPISISLSPNVEPDDIGLVLKLIFSFWKWKKPACRQAGENAIRILEDEFKKYIGVKYAFSFNSGRSALYAILKTLNLPQKTEVLLQAFTCNAAVNPVLWNNLNPIYVDCDENSFNMDIDDLNKKVKSLLHAQGRVLMVQHTFGLPANMEEVLSIVRQNGLVLIEDCAHALGAQYQNRKVGTFGKAGFFSFSRDKVISSVYGGMAVTNDDEIGERLCRAQADFGMPNRFWILQQLLHPILLKFIILPIYNFLDLGKIFLVLSQWLHILSKAVHYKEKRGDRPDYFPKALPNALCIMAHSQFNKLEKFNAHRKIISDFYYKELQNTRFILPEPFDETQGKKNIFLRFAVKHPKAHQIIYDAWHKENILLGDWYTTPIAPADTKLDKMLYKIGSCRNAEKLSKTTLNLPTHINISMKDAQRIIDFLKKWK